MRYVCPACGSSAEAGGACECGTARAPAGSDGLLGTTIGSWRVAAVLGAGGMGKVYRAVQPAIGARVAIKVLREELAGDAELVQRFFHEARSVNLIRHDNIVDIIDLGALEDGTPYIVMAYLDGASLGTRFRGARPAPFPLGALAHVIDEVLAALEAAHAADVVHRDLKPDNVFVSPTGAVTVLDFGIAKLARGDTLATQTGALLGTPAYMAPEQARGAPADARADLYAIGVMLYEGATGALPFAATNLYELLDQKVKGDPPAPARTKNPAIPETLDALIARALATDPADRWTTARELRTALAAIALPDAELPTLVDAAASKPTTPSDPHAPTAVSQAQSPSMAYGETRPSAPPIAPRRARWPLVAGGVAIAGLGALAIGKLAGSTSAPPIDAPPIVAVAIPPDAVIDAASPPPADAASVVAVVLDAPAPAKHRDPRRSPADAAIAIDAPRVHVPLGPAGPPGMLRYGDSPSITKLPPIAHATRVDPFALYPTIRDAVPHASGTLLTTGMTFRNVARDGTADVSASGISDLQFIFIVPSAPAGCIFIAEVSGGLGVISPPSTGNCQVSPIRPPRCTAKQLIDRAIASGEVSDTPGPFILNHIGARTWAVSTADESTQLSDDC